MSTADGATPGVQAHVPGEDNTDSSVGGIVPDGTAISHVDDDSLPAEDGLSSGGETVADDDLGDGGDDGALQDLDEGDADASGSSADDADRAMQNGQANALS